MSGLDVYGVKEIDDAGTMELMTNGWIGIVGAVKPGNITSSDSCVSLSGFPGDKEMVSCIIYDVIGIKNSDDRT